MPGFGSKAPTKIVVLGDANTGKTSLIRRLVGLPFDPDCPPTERQQVYPLESAGQFCDFWDCGPIDNEENLASLLTNVSVVILAFDVTQRATLDSIRNVWLDAVKRNLGPAPLNSVFFMMVGLKSDRVQLRDVSIEELESFATRNDLFFIEISNRDGTNADLALSILRIRGGRRPISSAPSPARPMARSSQLHYSVPSQSMPSTDALPRRMSGEFDRIERLFDADLETRRQQLQPQRQFLEPEVTESFQRDFVADEDEEEVNGNVADTPTTLRLHRSGSVDVSAAGLQLHVSAQGQVVAPSPKPKSAWDSPARQAPPSAASRQPLHHHQQQQQQQQEQQQQQQQPQRTSAVPPVRDLPLPPFGPSRDLLVDVSLGSGRVGTIRVGPRDDPLELAETFLIQHGLPQERAPELASVVRARIDDFLQQDPSSTGLTPAQQRLLHKTLRGGVADNQPSFMGSAPAAEESLGKHESVVDGNAPEWAAPEWAAPRQDPFLYEHSNHAQPSARHAGRYSTAPSSSSLFAGDSVNPEESFKDRLNRSVDRFVEPMSPPTRPTPQGTARREATSRSSVKNSKESGPRFENATQQGSLQSPAPAPSQHRLQAQQQQQQPSRAPNTEASPPPPPPPSRIKSPPSRTKSPASPAQQPPPPPPSSFSSSASSSAKPPGASRLVPLVDDSIRVPFFWVEVDIGGGKQAKLGVFRDDDLEQVASKFVKEHGLPLTKMLKLKQILEHQHRVTKNNEARERR